MKTKNIFFGFLPWILGIAAAFFVVWAPGQAVSAAAPNNLPENVENDRFGMSVYASDGITNGMHITSTQPIVTVGGAVYSRYFLDIFVRVEIEGFSGLESALNMSDNFTPTLQTYEDGLYVVEGWLEYGDEAVDLWINVVNDFYGETKNFTFTTYSASEQETMMVSVTNDGEEPPEPQPQINYSSWIADANGNDPISYTTDLPFTTGMAIYHDQPVPLTATITMAGYTEEWNPTFSVGDGISDVAVYADGVFTWTGFLNAGGASELMVSVADNLFWEQTKYFTFTIRAEGADPVAHIFAVTNPSEEPPVEPPDALIEPHFGINAGELDSGEVMTLTAGIPYDLLATVYPLQSGMTEILVLEFFGINPEWEHATSHGNGEWSATENSLIWTGIFPGAANVPVEVYIKVPGAPAGGQIYDLYATLFSDVGAPAIEEYHLESQVINHAIFLPLMVK